jgi:amidase
VPNLWSQLSVQGPMARSVADLALFLDTMAGFCPLDPLIFDTPAVSFCDGLAQTPSDIARADRERAAFYRRIVAFFDTYDLLVTPGAQTPAFDVNLRNAPTIGGQKLDNYMGGSTATAVITLSSCPAMVLPCGFDRFGRPVGLQLVGKPRGEAALLQAASLFEQLLGLNRLLPIDPKPGTVPPTA